MHEDATQLRNRQGGLAKAITRARYDSDTPSHSLVAMIVREDGDAWPPTLVDGYRQYKLKAVDITGGFEAGDILEYEPVGGVFVGRNEGSATPPDPATLEDDERTLVIATAVQGTYWFGFLGN